VPAGRSRKIDARAASGLRPGPLRGPARSWLTTVRSIPNAGDRLSRLRDAERGTPKGQRIGSGALSAKARTGAANHTRLARREAPARSRKDRDTIGFASFGAPSPHPEEGQRPVSKDRGGRRSNPGRGQRRGKERACLVVAHATNSHPSPSGGGMKPLGWRANYEPSGRGTPACAKAPRWRAATSARSAPAIVSSNRR
jgi:hypothetical protein